MNAYPREKFLNEGRLCEWSQKFLVTWVSGCFDLLHRGHLDYIEKAATAGSSVLVAMVNSDTTVRLLKGNTRPIQNEGDRAFALAALEWVDGVFVFDDLRLTEWIRKCRPYAWFKGGDYTIDSLDKSEVAAAREVGTRIEIIPTVFDVSTTKILSKI